MSKSIGEGEHRKKMVGCDKEYMKMARVSENDTGD